MGFWLLLLALQPSWAEETGEAPRARVIRATDPHALRLLVPVKSRVKHLLDAALKQYTGKDSSSIWKGLLKKSDRVGIKIHTQPGALMSTRPEVVEALIESLEASGISRQQVVIFDRYAPQMEIAGYRCGVRRDGVTVASTIPSPGHDQKAVITFPIPGKLIWGDLEFDKTISDKEDQISTKSYFSQIVTQKVDKWINVGVPMNDPNLGVYGCQLSASLSIIDNYRRLEHPSFTREESLTDLLKQDPIQKKCILHILDALLAQCAGGPLFDPSYCWPMASIYISRDPVALDSLALEQINQHRPRVEVAPLKDQVAYLKSAEEAGLGVADTTRIDIVETPGFQ